MLFPDRAFQGTVGLGHLKQIGTVMSAEIVTHDIGTYGDLDVLRSAYSARYTGYVLGASTRSHSESGYILSSTYEWPSPPTEYHPDSIDDTLAAIDAAVSDRGELPAVAAHAVDDIALLEDPVPFTVLSYEDTAARAYGEIRWAPEYRSARVLVGGNHRAGRSQETERNPEILVSAPADRPELLGHSKSSR